jgi:uncharacterized membrane protein YjjB (DUF3815 family)
MVAVGVDLSALLQDAFWSAVAATGFAMLFNVPVRTLPACALAGAVGHALRSALIGLGVTLEAATLVAATLIGVLGVFFARRWHAPSSIFTVSGAIPLVPGTFAFQTMIGVIRLAVFDPADSAAALVAIGANGIRTGLILAAIAVGIAAPGLFIQRKRPVV